MGRYKLRPAWRNNIRGIGQDAAAAYRAKILGYNPIAYWPLNETAGVTANCLVNALQDGTYTGVTLANTTGPNGDPAPFFDGANDYVSIFTAAFDAAFNGATGTAMIWMKPVNVGMWTDGAIRRPFTIYDDGNNYYYTQKAVVNNRFQWTSDAGGGFAALTDNAAAGTAWEAIAITWSDSANADEFKAFRNGAQYGATSAGLNAWAGLGLDAAQTLIGAATTAPVGVFHGWLAHMTVWDTALAPATLLDLATV